MATRPALVIFFSWASDFPTGTHQSFIEDALELAIARLHADADLRVEVRVDRDTRGVAGAPDIAGTIFRKIEESDVFVGDVSIIGHATPVVDGGDPRPTPNPNVLTELGYAAAQQQIGWDRVIPVFNEATGRVEDLPFDIRQRRIVTYRLAPNPSPGREYPEKKVQKAALAKALGERLALMVAESTPAGRKRRTRGPSPSLQVRWALSDAEPSTDLLVEPARLPPIEDHHREVESRRITESDLALLEANWGRIANLVAKHGKRVLGDRALPTLDEVRVEVAKLSRQIDEYIAATPTARDAIGFSHRARDRRVRVSLTVENDGTAKATEVFASIEPHERVRFFSDREIHTVGRPIPIRPSRLNRALSIVGRLDEVERELEETRAYHESLGSMDVSARIFNPAHEAAMLQLSRMSPKLRVQRGGLEARFPAGVSHGFSLTATDHDVWMLHSLEAGEAATLRAVCHANELPEPDECELVVRARADTPA